MQCKDSSGNGGVKVRASFPQPSYPVLLLSHFPTAALYIATDISSQICSAALRSIPVTMGSEMKEPSGEREWFIESKFHSGSTSRWTVCGYDMTRNLVLNPSYPDTIEHIQESMRVPALMRDIYIASKRLTLGFRNEHATESGGGVHRD